MSHHHNNPKDDEVEHCVKQLSAWTESHSPPLSPDEKAFCDTNTLRRYAVARSCDYNAAVKNLASSIAWRKEHVPRELHCTACDVDPHMHAFFPLGIDQHKRLVIYACSARAKTNDRDITVRHMVHTLEHAWRSTQALGLHHQWVWIVDFGGFSMWHAMQGSTSTATLQTFSEHFPERLGAVLLVNPPGLFDVLLAVVKTVADARTMSKVHILRCTPEGAPEALEPHGIPKDSGMARWFSQVMKLPGKPGSLPPMDMLDQEHLKLLSLPRMAGTRSS